MPQIINPEAKEAENKRIIKIPFDGFYCSHADSEIDYHLELFLYNQNDRDYMKQENREYEISYDDLEIDYSEIRKGFVKEYVSYFVDYLKQEFDLELSLEWESLQSPKFYNFETDRIFCFIPNQDIEKLYKMVDKTILKKVIQDNFTSRSGFISHYPNDLETWEEKPVLEWDHNELYTLLCAVLVPLLADSNNTEFSTATLIVWDRGFSEKIGNIVDNAITINPREAEEE